MKIKIELTLLICTCMLCLSFQNPRLDKLKSDLEADQDNDSLKCAYLGELGYHHAFRNYDSSLYYLNRALRCSDEIENKLLTTRYLNFLGMAYAVNGTLDSSVYAFEKAIKISREALMDSVLAQSLYGLGNVYHSKGDIDSSLEYFLEALSFFESSSDETSAIRAKANISVIYLSLGEYDIARPLIEETNNFYEKKGMEVGLRNGYERLSSVLKHKGQLDSALHYLDLARTLAVKQGETYAIGIIDNAIGGVFFLQKKYSQALTYLKSGADKHESINGDPEELIVIYGNLSFCYAVLGNKIESRKAIRKAEALLEETESIEFQISYYESRYRVDSVLNDFKSAFANHQKLLELNKLFLNEEKTEQISELQTKYDTEKKEAEILTLSQQSSIQALEIRQKNQVLIIGVIVFFFVLAAIYFTYKQREAKKRQSQTELEQRFLRSQLNPHFISNALVAVQSFMLKNDSDSAVLYLTKFSKLMRETLENSRREFITVEEEVSMLKNYMDIHKQRLGSFDYTIALDEAIEPEIDTIPPMFVQPFVENAVEHGVGSLSEGGKIELKFRKEGEFINIAVNDNGKGLAAKSNSEHKSLSTTIIQERIDLFNQALKNKIQLVIENIKNEGGEVSGTKVELKVPFGYL